MNLFNKKPKAQSPIKEAELEELNIPDDEELPEPPKTIKKKIEDDYEEYDDEEEYEEPVRPKKKPKIKVREPGEEGLTEEQVVGAFNNHERRLQTIEAFMYRLKNL